MVKKHLTPQARRAEEKSRARVETSKMDAALPLWQIALFGLVVGLLVLALA